jgi:hypothetical protein
MGYLQVAGRWQLSTVGGMQVCHPRGMCHCNVERWASVQRGLAVVLGRTAETAILPLWGCSLTTDAPVQSRAPVRAVKGDDAAVFPHPSSVQPPNLSSIWLGLAPATPKMPKSYQIA